MTRRRKSVFQLLQKLHPAFTMVTFGEANAALDESILDFLDSATSTQHSLSGMLNPRDGGRSNSCMLGKLFD
jgi:hypothetical protein